MRALIDQEQGWHKTLSNVPLPDSTAGTGVVGATKDISFDIQDADCDANQLNAARITTLVPISGRLRFWGRAHGGGDRRLRLRKLHAHRAYPRRHRGDQSGRCDRQAADPRV